MTKICNHCKEEKPLEAFSWKLKATNTRHSYCKACKQLRDTTSFRHSMVRQFGITPTQYLEMFERQGGLCLICKEPEKVTRSNGEVINLAIDHDHACCPGQMTCGNCIRGLLCRTCNWTVGAVERDPSLISEVFKYLGIVQTRK